VAADLRWHAEGGALRPYKFGGYMCIYDELINNFVITMDFQLNDTGQDYSCNSGIFFRLYPLDLKYNPNATDKKNPFYDIGFNGIELAIDQTPGTGYTDTGAL
jgi:hypothetical protein